MSFKYIQVAFHGCQLERCRSIDLFILFILITGQYFWATVTSSSSPYATGQLSCPVCLAKGLDGSRCHLVRRYSLGPDDIVLDGDPAATHGQEQSSPHFSAHFYCGQTVVHLSYC